LKVFEYLKKIGKKKLEALGNENPGETNMKEN